MRDADLAAGEQAGQDRCDVGLARLIAGALDARIERHIAAQSSIGAHGTRDQGGIEQATRLEQAGDRERRRDLRAVEQRQALLGGQRQWGEADGRQGLGCGHLAPAQSDPPDADQGARDMGQGSEVARGAH
jgi:hypothetical protein